MIPELRTAYNAQFKQESYEQMKQEFGDRFNHIPPFNIAETPIFIPQLLKNRLLEACEEIIDVIVSPDFKKLSASAIPEGQEVPNETDHTTFLQLDFGICRDENGAYIPQLIEAQGFPSLYFYQAELAKLYRKYFQIPEHMNHLFGGLTDEEYINTLREIIVGDTPPEQVVLLEVEPEKQATQIDFWITKHYLGIEVLCVTDLKMDGKDAYYVKDGRKIPIQKIYNRVIFDELIKREDLGRSFYFVEEINAKWIGHPNWFFRISKHTLPFLKSKYVPKSMFLKDLDQLPDDLHNYVLKPLYSFAGSGVIINLNPYDITSISDPENYILQRKVQYEPVIQTLDVNAKCEIRMLMLWPEGEERPRIINNLVRLSKGHMVGVRYNKGKTWVGGSIGFFE